MKKNYVIGVDFGTLSCRAVAASAENGEIVSSCVVEYPHAVMDEFLPCGTPIPPDSAYQHPDDYIYALSKVMQGLFADGNVLPEQIAGMGFDFTACTLMALDADGTPLCKYPELEHDPNAYAMLWKHHGAREYADEINRVAGVRREKWLKRYGGKVSSEWMLPKIMQVLNESPAVYEKTVRFSEAADWMSRILTDSETHSASFAGIKALWSREDGMPNDEFLALLDERLVGIIGTKVSDDISDVGTCAGYIGQRGHELTGLPVGTPVAIPLIDAHSSLPALGTTKEGEMMLILGTSGCQIINSRTGKDVEGICGYVKNGLVPDHYVYEAGQTSLGDCFDWFVKRCVPSSYQEEADKNGIGLHKLLRDKVSDQKPGESGLMALDWFNGNRSILQKSNLSGMILGITLTTKPEEIYRALIEATAYSTRMIVEQYKKFGISVDSIHASGGIALKDPMLMQIYADVLKCEIKVAHNKQSAALGGAMYGAVVGGIYENILAASEKMSTPAVMTYTPDEENGKLYDVLYEEYVTLHDYFGMGKNKIMERLNKIKS